MKKTLSTITIAITALISAHAFQFDSQVGVLTDPGNPANPINLASVNAANKALLRMGPTAASADGEDIFTAPVFYAEQSAAIAKSNQPSFSSSLGLDTLVGFDFMVADKLLVGLMADANQTHIDVKGGAPNRDADIEQYVVSTYFSGTVYENWILGASFSTARGKIEDDTASANDTRTRTFAASPFVSYTNSYKDNFYWSITALANYQSTKLKAVHFPAQADFTTEGLDASIRARIDYDYSEMFTFNLWASYTSFITRDVNRVPGAAAFSANGNLDEDWFNIGAGVTIRDEEHWDVKLNIEMDAGQNDYDSFFPSFAATYTF